jgi:hypothetical protein
MLVLFIYITRPASNEIFSSSNKTHRELGWATDLSAPRYVLKTSKHYEDKTLIVCINFCYTSHQCRLTVTAAHGQTFYVTNVLPFC